MRAIAVVLALLATGALVSGCGNERSVESFCSTLSSEKERILSQFEETSDPGSGEELVDVLAGLGASLQAIGELRTYFRKLAEVAPAEIQEEAELVAEDYEKQFENLENAGSDPLGSLFGGLIGGIGGSGQLNAVNEFALDNCGESV